MGEIRDEEIYEGGEKNGVECMKQILEKENNLKIVFSF